MTSTEASDVSLGGETAKATVAKFTMAAAGFVGTILFARLLGSAGIGGYYLLFTIVQMTNQPVNGVSEAVQKRLSETDLPSDEAITFATLLAIGWTALGVLVATLLRSHLEAYVGFDGAVVAFGSLLGVLNLFVLYQGALSATGRIGRTRWIDAVRSYLTLPSQIAFVWLGFGAAGMVYGEALATVVLLVPLVTSMAVRYRRPTLRTAKSLWTYARYSIPNGYLSRIYSELDILILGALATQAAAGHYGVALRLSLPATFLAMVASAGLFSRVSNLLSKGRSVEEDVRNTLAFTSLFAVPMFFGGLVLSQELVVTLYGPEFRPAGALLVGLLVYQIIRTQTMTLGKIIAGLDRPELLTRVYFVLLVVNVVLGIGLTLRIGALGVVIATVVAESVRYLGLAFYLRRELPTVPLITRPLATQVLCGLAMGMVLFVLKGYVRIDSWIPLVGLVGLGGAIYFGTLFAASPVFRWTVLGTLDDLHTEWQNWNPFV